MTTNDPISDCITRIRNAQMVGIMKVTMPHSQIKEAVVKVLKEEGYVSDFSVGSVNDNIKTLSVDLTYRRNKPVIKSINRVSKPGRRVYFSANDLKTKRFFNGLGVYVISTSKGVLSDKDARSLNIGGEVICNVY